jgi:alkane 1-monooxygenase
LLNYTEHYGLRREKDENGVYESVGYMHAWNALASAFMFRAQRHSDHHAHKYRPMQILIRLDHAPTMPYEYIFMFFLALFPPLWFYLMDPMVISIEDAR